MEKEYTQKYLQINRSKNIIFDAEDMPFFSVAPEYSDLGESIPAAEQFTRNFPSLSFDQACVVDGAVIIQDIMQKSDNLGFIEKVKNLNKATSITLQIVDGMRLTESMLQQLKQNVVSTSNPIVVLPGNGASSVSEYITSLSPTILNNSYQLPTTRTMTKPGKFELSIDYSSLPKNLNSQQVIIVDDVVASGQTASTLGYDLRCFYPNTKINLATWLYLWPNDKNKTKYESGIGYIDKTTASIALKGNYVSRPPINSLSCLLMNDPLSQQKLAAFTSKYAKNPELFYQLLQEIKTCL